MGGEHRAGVQGGLLSAIVPGDHGVIEKPEPLAQMVVRQIGQPQDLESHCGPKSPAANEIGFLPTAMDLSTPEPSANIRQQSHPVCRRTPPLPGPASHPG